MMTKSPSPSFVRTYLADHLKPVVQEDRTGCGIASAAMLGGVTYQHAKEVAARLGIQVTDSRLWSDTTFIRILLKHYGIETDPQEQPFCSWASLPPLALLAIKWQRKGDRAFWHWVIFGRTLDRAVVLDPNRFLKTNIRTDFGRINPQWFIKINPALAIPNSSPAKTEKCLLRIPLSAGNQGLISSKAAGQRSRRTPGQLPV